MATLYQAEAGPLRSRSQVVLVDQGAEYDPGKIRQPDGDDVLQETALAHHLQAAGLDGIHQLDGAVATRGAGETEAQLVYGQAEVFDLVVREAEPTGQARRSDPGQPQELGAGWDHQADFVGVGHDR